MDPEQYPNGWVNLDRQIDGRRLWGSAARISQRRTGRVQALVGGASLLVFGDRTTRPELPRAPPPRRRPQWQVATLGLAPCASSA